MINNENRALIRRYLYSMINMYGIIPLRHAYHIFEHQNPLLNVDEDDFWEFTMLDQSNQDYNIAGEKELAKQEDGDDDEDEEFYLYGDWVLMDLPEDFNQLKRRQHDRIYYVPAKDEFLRRENEWYYERTTATEEYRQYLRDTNPDLSDDRLEEAFFEALTQLHSVSYGSSPEDAVEAIPKQLRRMEFNVPEGQEKELERLLRRMLDGTRQEALRGKMYKYHDLPTALEMIESKGLSPENVEKIHTGEIDAIEIARDVEPKQPDLAEQLVSLYQQ
ncbi:hypothetical protein [Lactobacillus porci]|uniref:Uncharacterized protein n=1 Tax=Lactobacillus porci TaxID=2012477 RepID=A0A6A8MFL4_9LACO|nr:hypothetical protein [Lactobacillus porci]MST87575.1 hypothetical protein [Lactobacillus porci]